MPAAVAAEVDRVRGIAPAELATRARVRADGLSARELERWLVFAGLATVGADGLLRPTARVFELEWPGSFVEIVDG